MAEPHCNLGVALVVKGQFEEAEKALRNSISLGYDEPFAHQWLVSALRGLWKLDEAIAEAQLLMHAPT